MYVWFFGGVISFWTIFPSVEKLSLIKKKQNKKKESWNKNQVTFKRMQVPQVTEEIAMAVVDLYPTILSLASAYSLLVSPDFLDDFLSYSFLFELSFNHF